MIGATCHGCQGSSADVRHRSWYATKFALAAWENCTEIEPRAPLALMAGAVPAVSVDLCGGVQCG